MAINMEEWGANCNHLRTFGTYFCFDCSAPQHLVRFPDPLADGSQAETLSTQRPSSLLLDFMAILDSAVFSENDFFLQNYYLDCTLRRGPQDDFLLILSVINTGDNSYLSEWIFQSKEGLRSLWNYLVEARHKGADRWRQLGRHTCEWQHYKHYFA